MSIRPTARKGEIVIPYGRQSISEADIDAVVQVLRSDFLTQGPAVPRFEEAVARYCGAAHALAVNSATSALHIACLALGVGPGQIVWTSPITFVASANCALYCGAAVDFVDVDPATHNMSVDALAAKLEGAEREGRLPSVVIPVHMAGQPCDMAGIHALGQRYGFRIIEDASHAVGASYRGKAVGNCAFSAITVFSFHPVKIITTAEGGIALTNDAALAERMALLRSHGITRDETRMDGPSHGPWYYQQLLLGFNYRMTDMQAALGASQMDRLDRFVARRRELAANYDAAFLNCNLTVQQQPPESRSSYHLYLIHLDDDGAGRRRQVAFEALRRDGIGVNVHYIPVHLQPYYRDLGFRPGDFPAAEHVYSGAISVPLYAGMSDGDQADVVSAVKAAARL